MAAQNQDPKSDEDLLETARTRFKAGEEAEREIRRLGREDREFRAGHQWPEKILQDRTNDNRPCHVVNRMPQFIRQVTNDQRQNRPAIKVHPVDDSADVDTARILGGIIRHIEYNSGADAAYDTAFEGAAISGYGFYRVLTEYVDPLSFDQEILIKRIRDAESVMLDPNAKEPDGSDANWGFIYEDMPCEEYDQEYGKGKAKEAQDWATGYTDRSDWATKDTIRVAEYFYKEFKNEKILLLDTGETVTEKDLKEKFPERFEGSVPDTFTLPIDEFGSEIEVTVVSRRTAKVSKIKWCKLNGMDVLEKTDWRGRWIPIIPVYGDELVVNGEIIREGIIRHAKDSQRMLNYWESMATEAITLAPKAPYIVAEGQVPKTYQHMWASANTKNHPYIVYKPTDHMGQLVSPPQRQSFEPAIMAITQAKMGASQSLKETTGIYDSALGDRSNETSGIAIQRRNVQAQTSNFHLIDNLTRSIRHTGRILIDLIPHVYDTARAARIIGEEGEQEIIRVNEEFEHNGKPVTYSLGKGKYDVVVDTGPSFATRRQEAAQSMIEMSRANPAIMQQAGDLIVKNMDWPGAQEIAKRITPPQFQQGEDGKDQEPLPPQVQAQMQESGQMIEMLTEQLKQLQAEREKDLLKYQDKELDRESKERIAYAKNEIDIGKALVDMESADARIILQAELDHINQMQAQQSGPTQETDARMQPQSQGLPPQQSTGGYTPAQPPEMGGF